MENRGERSLLFKLLLLAVTPILAVAQTTSAPATTAPSTNAPTPAPQVQHGYRRVTLDDRVKQLAKALDLSDAQQVGVKRVLEHQQAEIAKLRTDQTPGTDVTGRVRFILQNTAEQIRALLNDDQKKKYTFGTVKSPPPESNVSVEDWLKMTQPKTKQ